jgi:hypothetical protein
MILKPCPFGCDHPEDLEVVQDDTPPVTEQSWVVQCGCCLARGPWTSTKSTAKELWNKRGDSVEEKKEYCGVCGQLNWGPVHCCNDQHKAPPVGKEVARYVRELAELRRRSSLPVSK